MHIDRKFGNQKALKIFKTMDYKKENQLQRRLLQHLNVKFEKVLPHLAKKSMN